MSYKQEQAAKKIGFNGFAFDSLEEIRAYLLEQFPEPVKIEGIRELVSKVAHECIQCTHDVFYPGKCEKIITDFIEKREVGKEYIADEVWDFLEYHINPTNGKTKVEIYEDFRHAFPLPPAPKE